MKTILVLLVSSLFLSNIPESKENDSIEKVMAYKIEKTSNIKTESIVNSRAPIIIVKRD
ncbi:hypothetical protein [Flavobacterium helocola]|jgi:hypothetical protein|uniref:Uncharacterized protein n=1 Tax=Flavobacterium helocola TaxID=3139139 RepID=A0ABU9I5E8_9FLAO